MEPGGLMPHSQGLPNNPYPGPNQPNSSLLISISLKSILILSSHLWLGLPKSLCPVGLPVKILEALLPSSILATWPCPSQSSRFNHPDYIRWTVQTMKFLIVNPSPLPIRIRLGPKYIRLMILFSNTFSLHSSLNVRDHASNPDRTTCNLTIDIQKVFKFSNFSSFSV